MMQVIAPLFLASLVAGHGHITNIVINGVSYEGWDIDSFPYESDPPTVVAWGTPNTGNGFISPEYLLITLPDAYGTSDIICHENATNAKGYATIAAGDKVNLQWTAWPDSHHGPVITYLANCGDSCETVDKTTLEFFKISGVGLVSDTDVPGTWGDDQLIANNNSWLVEIPPTIEAGYYVLRNEIIALHSAEESDGAQNYPQCFNLHVTGSGTESPTGVLGTELYSSTDAGILVNIYASLSTYDVPGPTLYSGAVSVTQAISAITSTGTATAGSGDSAQTTSSAAAAAAAATSASTSSSTDTPIAVPTTASSSSSAEVSASETATPAQQESTSSATVLATAPASTITTAPSSSSVAAAGGSVQSLYGQCGGINWTGATACTTQAVCSSMNPYYYQCVASAA
ncbi:uncharacterized protein N7484_008105 [Penicillium longicatenatum]|uniref:uncharacterized protein n=1 Tax=Penicillium longicatenatum TaxID=1561947 RepID=UPI002549BB00|nr:uncharacterized protein N7484_008105 [Penicillium longicatenatum]KAJ5640243.1 hypothetical protein N7484_008105 [Penicillium longicatenatum]